MARDKYEIDSYLDDFHSDYNELRSVFFEIPTEINTLNKTEPGDAGYIGPVSILKFAVKEDRERDTFTLKFMSRLYEFRFTAPVIEGIHGYTVKGNVTVVRKFAHEPEDQEGIGVAIFDFDPQGTVTGLDFYVRRLKPSVPMAEFLAQLIYTDLVADARAKSGQARAKS